MQSSAQDFWQAILDDRSSWALGAENAAQCPKVVLSMTKVRNKIC